MRTKQPTEMLHIPPNFRRSDWKLSGPWVLGRASKILWHFSLKKMHITQIHKFLLTSLGGKTALSLISSCLHLKCEFSIIEGSNIGYFPLDYEFLSSYLSHGSLEEQLIRCVCVCMCVSIHPSVYLFLSSCLSIFLFFCLSISLALSIYLPTCLPTCLSLWKRRVILINWLMWLWRLTRPKLAGQAGRLETQEKESILWLECKCIWRQNFLFFQEPQSFLCLQWIGWSPPTLQRVLDFVQSLPIWMVSTSNKYLHSNNLIDVWPNIWALWSSQADS